MRVHTVERSTFVSQMPAEVYAWHSRPGAFERLTPPWERVELLERSGGLERGARTVLRVRAGGRWMRWVAVHQDHEAGRRFVDAQVEGPFAHWRHSHEFAPEGDGTRVTDRIEYAPPFGLVGAMADRWSVRRKIERLLAYRHTVLADDLAAHARFRGHPRLRVAITGATGLIGRALRAFLTSGGHDVIPLVRRRTAAEDVAWDPDSATIDAGALEGVDAVVHLAGENVAAGRWTAARKRRIVESRTSATRFLATTLARLARPPGILVSASAVGIYGPRGDEVLTESSAPGPDADFFARLAREWETGADPARQAGIRVAHPRFGVVLSPRGGALAKLLLPFRAGVGGPLGNGRMWMSWVSLDDAVAAIQHALFTTDLTGPFNVVAPGPVTNRQFAATLGRVLHRPAALPVPAAALRLAFGEMADATVLASIRVLPRVLEEQGYMFRHPQLEPTLRYLLGRAS
ncbi:MAG TPA: TIGR01777 family oxidoreductase [Gemmatimonadales bacterium]|nr:TIGR01777 family oxidoreductase [Gemmatimonadales bacterium]